MMFSIRQLQEKCIEQHKDLYQHFTKMISGNANIKIKFELHGNFFDLQSQKAD